MKKDWLVYLNEGICITVLLIIIGVKLFFPYDNHAQSLSQNLEKAKNQVTMQMSVKILIRNLKIMVSSIRIILRFLM